MQLAPERLAELRRIAEAATPGPWTLDALGMGVVGSVETPDGIVVAQVQRMSGDTDGTQREGNARYIATFDPQTVLSLLDEIERLMERQRRVRHALRAAMNHIGEPQHPYERAGISHLQLALQVLDGRYDREGGGAGGAKRDS